MAPKGGRILGRGSFGRRACRPAATGHPGSARPGAMESAVRRAREATGSGPLPPPVAAPRKGLRGPQTAPTGGDLDNALQRPVKAAPPSDRWLVTSLVASRAA